MLEAASRVIADKGFVGATLEEIATLAEFGKGTLYNYFPGGKDEILFAIVSKIYDDLIALIEASFPGGDLAAWARDGRSWFFQFIDGCFRYFDERGDLFVILTREAHRMCFSDKSDRLYFFLSQRDRLATALAVPVRQAIEAGTLRPFPPHAVAHLVMGNILGVQMHRALDRSAKCPMKVASMHDPEASPSTFLSSLLFDGLLTGPSQPNNASH